MTAEVRFTDAERSQALDLIGRIYDGTFKPEIWPGVVRDIVGYVGGSKGLLFTSFDAPKDGGFTFPHVIPESAMQQWADHFIEHDVWTQAGIAKGLIKSGNVSLGTELVPEDEFLTSVLYRDFFRPLGVAQLCIGVIFGQDSADALPTVCSVYRDISEPRFSDIERQRMQVLIPHLSRALGVMYRLRDAELKRAATLAALDRLSGSVILLDSRGCVLHANPAARRILTERDGLALSGLRDGERRLAASDMRTQTALENAVRDCLRPDALQVPHFARGVPVPRPSGDLDYALQFAPLNGAEGFRTAEGDARAIVFVADPAERLQLDPALLKRIFRLTPAEIRLLEEIVAGATMGAAALSLGISENTARSQLKKVFERTGTNRQADLVRLLVSLSSTT